MKFLMVALLTVLTAAAFASDVPVPPDYSTIQAWAAYPGQSSHANDTPAGVERAATPTVAVFFIHPTTYLAPVFGNAAYDARGEVGERVDDAVLRFQASVFNGCCRIYAPRYRQASLKAITSNSPQGYAAAELAYADVRRAFAEFLNQNRHSPFILASHSQGSIHGMRLLEEQFAKTPLMDRLIAAYVIGVALPREIKEIGLPICDRAEQSGCLVTWNSVRQGHTDHRRLEDSMIWWQGSYQAIAGRPIVCVNPLDWREDSEASDAANLGAVYSAGRSAPIPAPVAHLTGAACNDGLLGVDIPLGEKRHFSDALTLFGVYHDFDYGLFYMNIRDNVGVRLRNWQASHH